MPRRKRKSLRPVEIPEEQAKVDSVSLEFQMTRKPNQTIDDDGNIVTHIPLEKTLMLEKFLLSRGRPNFNEPLPDLGSQSAVFMFRLAHFESPELDGILSIVKAKESLERKEPLSSLHWALLIDEIVAGVSNAKESERLLDSLNDLYKTYGENFVVLPDLAAQGNRKNPNSILAEAIKLRMRSFHHYPHSLFEMGSHIYGVKDWVQYQTRLRDYLDSKTYKQDELQILETAKRLSVSKVFQNILHNLRLKWEISPPRDRLEFLFKEKPAWFHPDELLNLVLPMEASREEFHADLRDLIFSKSKTLDFHNHYGLVMAALCVGLEPKNVLNDWHLIWAIAIHRGASSTVEYIADNSLPFMSAILSIVYIVEYFMPEVLKQPPKHAPPSDDEDMLSQLQENLPVEVANWVAFAVKHYQELKDLGMSDIPTAIRDIDGFPRPNYSDGALYIRIGEDTNINDIKALWPRVELARMNMQDVPENRRKKLGTWDEYQRDMRWKEAWDKFHSNVKAIRYLEMDDFDLGMFKQARSRWEKLRNWL